MITTITRSDGGIAVSLDYQSKGIAGVKEAFLSPFHAATAQNPLNSINLSKVRIQEKNKKKTQKTCFTQVATNIQSAVVLRAEC